QQPDLMPYTTVAENMGSHLRGPDHRKHKVRIQQLVAIMGLRGLEKTKVNALSGGQQQRVAIAKALAQIPAVLLLDEAFGNIDTFRKNMLRRHIFEFAERNNITCITATHDSGEALEFADTVLILKNGTVETMGTPVSIFGNLSNGYRAGFFGDFSTLPASLFNKGAAPGKNLFLLSHQLKISASETLIKVSVVKCYFKGSHYVVAAVHNGETVYFHHPRALPAGSVHYLERC
ncbi:MAG: ATP-binding cassette domain-containing protein, partial [Marinirhabdus sp.]